MLHALLYVIISSLPNDEVMFLYQNYGLLKLGKYFERALYFYLRRYFFYYTVKCSLPNHVLIFILNYFHTVNKMFCKI